MNKNITSGAATVDMLDGLEDLFLPSVTDDEGLLGLYKSLKKYYDERIEQVTEQFRTDMAAKERELQCVYDVCSDLSDRNDYLEAKVERYEKKLKENENRYHLIVSFQDPELGFEPDVDDE